MVAHPFPELLLEEGTYNGHDDADVPGLVQKVDPLETTWKCLLQRYKTNMTCPVTVEFEVIVKPFLFPDNQGMCNSI